MAAGRMVAERSETGLAPGRLDFKTKLLTAVVVLANVFGNFSLSWGMKHQASRLADSPLAYIQTIFSPWVLLGTTLLIVWLGRSQLCVAGDFHRVCVHGVPGKIFLR